MPVLPSHQGWSASQARTSSASRLFPFEVLVAQHALRVAGAAEVDADTGVAVPGDVRVVDGVANGGEVAFAVGDVLQHRRHGFASEEVGRQMRAESRMPSDMGMQTCSSSFVAYGRLVT